MIVIADTSPINYLIIIDEIDVLPQLYGRVIVSDGVADELISGPAPSKVVDWLKERPDWLEVRQLSEPLATDLSERLDRGESESIQLAGELKAEVLLMDEKRGRRVALERGFKVIGVLGILSLASEQGHTEFDPAIEKLKRTNFYVSQRLLDGLRK